MSTVWILGAGFSQSLGGPLFGTLFNPSSMGNLQAHFPPGEFSALYGTAADVAHFLYNFGRRFGLGRAEAWHRESGRTGEDLWQNAEEYLHILDTAASAPNSPWAIRISRIVETHLNRTRGPHQKPTLADINGAARRLLAAECSAFIRTLDLNSERAIDYRDWAARLGPQDTIITFNYDTLLERLGDASDKIDCIVPDGGTRRPGAQSMASAYKLHGSVDWLVADAVHLNPEKIQRDANEFAAVRCERYARLVIGSPGQTKSKLTDVLYDKLWMPAGIALSRASAIVFIGYRFPPTDTFARQFFLDSIEKNKSPYLAVHVALGENRGSPVIVRMHELLAGALATRRELRFGDGDPSTNSLSFNLKIPPYYATDFLGRVKGDRITRPYGFSDLGRRLIGVARRGRTESFLRNRA